MLVEANHESVFYYKKTTKEDVPREYHKKIPPFTIGIQIKWQRKKMLKHGHM
jgi:hypothetical protein